MAATNAVGYPLTTYRYVRLSLIAVVAGLLASVVLTAAPHHCWQNSISAFYFTTTHAVFIATLCAAGICLVAYKGITRAEDVLLNFSGFLAFVVAFVPATSPVNNPKDPAGSCGLWLPTVDDATSAVANNIAALVIGTLIGLAALLLVSAQARPAPRTETDRATEQPTGWVARLTGVILGAAQYLAPVIVGLALAAGLLWFLLDRKSFIANGHSAAAIGLFCGVIAVVLLYACYAAQHFCRCDSRGRFAAFYLAIAAAMTITLIVIAALHVNLPTWNHWILALETLLILEFSAFWLVQTTDTWNGPYQPALPVRGQQASSSAATSPEETRND